MRTFLTSLFILFSILQINSQPVQQEWAARYNGPANNDDEAYCIAVDDSGNVYVTGASMGNGTDYDYETVKYNSTGAQQWVTAFNGVGNGLDQPHALAIDTSGNVYVTGRSYNGFHYNYATVKYNKFGVQQWVQIYNGPGNDDDEAYALVVDNLGNVYVTGSSFGAGWNGTDCVTIKYNTSGILQWIDTFSSPGGGQTQGNCIKVDASGNVYVGGFCTYSNPLADRRCLTIKYNSSGIQQWTQNYHFIDNAWDEVHAIAVDGQGNVYVTGQSVETGYNYDYVTIKYNPLGVQQWVERYNGPGNGFDNAESIAVDAAGNVFVTGYSMGVSSGYDYATIKYNSSGVQQWLQRYDGPADSTDVAYSMALDLTENVYVSGYSRASSSGGWGDYATIRYSPSGVQQWIQRYNGTGDSLDRAQSIIVDKSGNVYVTGYSIGVGTNYDYATIKYSQPNGLNPLSDEIPDKYGLFQNYPNPFNPTTRIKFDIPAKGYGNEHLVRLIIYDLLGKKVATLVNEQLNPGSYVVEWDATVYPSGAYFYKLTEDEFVITKKMILIK